MKRITTLAVLLIISQASLAHDIEVKALKSKAPIGTMVYLTTQHFVRLINNHDTNWAYKFEYTSCPTIAQCKTYHQDITVPPHSTFEDRRSFETAHKYYERGKYRLCAYTDVFGEGQKHAEDCVNIEVY